MKYCNIVFKDELEHALPVSSKVIRYTYNAVADKDKRAKASIKFNSNSKSMYTSDTFRVNGKHYSGSDKLPTGIWVSPTVKDLVGYGNGWTFNQLASELQNKYGMTREQAKATIESAASKVTR